MSRLNWEGGMEYFSFGLYSLAGTVLFPALYVAFRSFKYVGAVIEREELPKDMVLPKVILWAVFGLALGSFAQPQVNKIAECGKNGLNVLDCYLQKH
ncbi:hypothetical protein [Undibacterium umbellatum]|uniref:Uncharacterized protein n=1 Tax=Undibacterium umbellatum TaxID=2762300 RepID=A0ABR6Z3V6_9BURK|nr:hypothetical protein [Undibacterium umbellatum]MBC3906236.1 hypothetical protein [Undibacterium umbellatum]